MPLEKLNAALIGAIQNSTPEYTNAAAILTDKLNIGREAAYRRLRGEVPFTFGEAGVLSAQMNFSLDRTVGALDFGNVLFRLSFSDYHTALEDYTGVIDQDTLFYREVSSDVDAEQAIAGNSFPRMLYMRYPKLTNFKLFKWLYQQGLIDCSGAKFEDMKVPEVLLQSYRESVCDIDIVQRGVAADSFLQAAASCRGRIGKGGLRTLPRSLPGINGTLRLVPWCLSCASNPDGFSTCVTFAGVARPLHNPT